MNDNIDSHNFSLIDRKIFSSNGVTDVVSFDEQEIRCKTNCGNMLIKGENLNVEVLDLSCEKLEITGKVNAIVYSDAVQTKGIFKSLFSK